MLFMAPHGQLLLRHSFFSICTTSQAAACEFFTFVFCFFDGGEHFAENNGSFRSQKTVAKILLCGGLFLVVIAPFVSIFFVIQLP